MSNGCCELGGLGRGVRVWGDSGWHLAGVELPAGLGPGASCGMWGCGDQGCTQCGQCDWGILGLLSHTLGPAAVISPLKDVTYLGSTAQPAEPGTALTISSALFTRSLSTFKPRARG